VRVWIDLANSPHVPLLVPVVERLEAEGHEVLLTARDHAQTVQLARAHWPSVPVVGGASPPGRIAKASAITGRAVALRRFARRTRPAVAFSHGSYSQLLAARAAGVPGVTMMDYEHQPANHLSFRIARRVIVPDCFPDDALRRFGAAPAKVLRYEGFKEELYLSGFEPDARVLDELGLDPSRVIAVFRPPPEGALYHPMANTHFADVLAAAREREDVQIVVLPRTPDQRVRYATGSGHVAIPDNAVDAPSLLALADVTVGGGGTMTRESAILGTPTYTVFAGRLAAVDAALVNAGRLHDLRASGTRPRFEKKPARVVQTRVPDAESLLSTILSAIFAVGG
jgi:predicted glycosyltransferase